MNDFRFLPSVDNAKNDEIFTQTILLLDGKRSMGKISWNALPEEQGVVQVLELWIDPSIRRHGHARRLMGQLITQARLLHKSRKLHLRRLWVGVGHKTQVVGRSFLTSEGFHHVGSTGGLLKDEDMLIYVKSLD